MKSRRWMIWTLAACVLGCAEARAHFLFAKIGPVAEGGRSAEVYFSERAEAGDPKFVEKIASTKLWLQTNPGEFRPLTVRQGVDRLKAHVPASGPLEVVGECQYGVIARTGQTPFLLRYYPKAVAGAGADLNKLKPRPGAALEIAAEFEGDRINLLALRDGKPLPKASFHAVDADLKESEFLADEGGRATWKPTSTGTYTVYFRSDVKTPGELEGKKYDEIREFATLAFDWPLIAEGADAEAVSTFEDAIAARAQWKDFPGFTAQVTGQVEDRSFKGTVTVDGAGNAKAELDDPSAMSWVEGQLASIAMHRIAQEPGERPSLRFLDDDDNHPLGRLLAFKGGTFASSYRVKDRQITSVNRHMGKMNMTIITLDNEKTPDGHFLPLGYSVQYWDDQTGDLRRTESIRDRWTRVAGFDLPTSHTVTTSADGGQSTRGLTLTGHKLAPSN
jgi:Protein of unknown function (DUF3386)